MFLLGPQDNLSFTHHWYSQIIRVASDLAMQLLQASLLMHTQNVLLFERSFEIARLPLATEIYINAYIIEL